MSSDLERLVATLATLGQDADALRNFVATSVREQRQLTAELHRLVAREPRVRRALDALAASVAAAATLDPFLANVTLATTRFAGRVLSGGTGTESGRGKGGV